MMHWVESCPVSFSIPTLNTSRLISKTVLDSDCRLAYFVLLYERWDGKNVIQFKKLQNSDHNREEYIWFYKSINLLVHHQQNRGKYLNDWELIATGMADRDQRLFHEFEEAPGRREESLFKLGSATTTYSTVGPVNLPWTWFHCQSRSKAPFHGTNRVVAADCKCVQWSEGMHTVDRRRASAGSWPRLEDMSAEEMMSEWRNSVWRMRTCSYQLRRERGMKILG